MSGTRTGQVKRTHTDTNTEVNPWKDGYEEHQFAFFQPSLRPKKRSPQNTERFRFDDRPVLSIFSLEEANTWMEVLRTALVLGNTSEISAQILWEEEAAAGAFQAFFCGRKVIFDGKEYQIDIENCLINFTLAVMNRSYAIVDAIWLASRNLLIKKISELDPVEQIDLLNKLVRNSPDFIIRDCVAGIMDSAVLEVVKKSLLRDRSNVALAKCRILQARIIDLFKMERQAFGHTPLISYPVLPGSPATELAQFGLLPRRSVPSARSAPLESSPDEEAMAAMMLLRQQHNR